MATHRVSYRTDPGAKVSTDLEYASMVLFCRLHVTSSMIASSSVSLLVAVTADSVTMNDSKAAISLQDSVSGIYCS